MEELKSKSFIISVVVAVALIGITIWLYQMISGVSEGVSKLTLGAGLLTENNNVLLREREQNKKTLDSFTKTQSLVERQNAKIEYLLKCITKIGASVKKTDTDFKLPRSNDRRVRIMDHGSDDDGSQSDRYSDDEDYDESPRRSHHSGGSRSRGHRDQPPPPPASELEAARERRRQNQRQR